MSLNDGLARPKSQTLSLQSEFARMFLGLRSRWNTLAAVHMKKVSLCGTEAEFTCAAS